MVLGIFKSSNLALNRPATQSSTSPWSTDPDPAKDARFGNNGRLKGGGLLHTSSEPCPWWQVDLGRPHLVERMVIFNRDVAQHRLRHFSVLRSMDGEDWRVAFSKTSDESFDEFTAPLPPHTVARYLRIRLDGAGCLHFRECQVFGKPVDSKAQGLLPQAEAEAAEAPDLLPPGRKGHISKVGGFAMFVDEDKYGQMICAWLDSDRYEHRERGLVRQFVQPGDRVLEIGTAIGAVSMTAASIVGANNVATFDANPEIVADAKANFRRNGLDGIRAEVGLLENRRRFRPGQREKFYIAEAFWGSRLGAGPNAAGIVKTVEIPVLCLEDEIARSRANAMVCDIEGGEVDLLTDADLSPIRLIIMETHYANVGEKAIDAMIGRLIGSGFSMDLIASKDQVVVLRKHDFKEPGGRGDAR